MDSLKTIAILGTGSMGIDLGLLASLHGFDVILWHRKDSRVALDRLTARIEKYVGKDILSASDREMAMSRINVSSQLDDLSDVDLVIETIAENLTDKSTLLNRVGQVVSEACIVVSNTSSLSVEELASYTRDPRRFAGLHFFNPALKMELVEIVAGPETSCETIAELKQFVARLGKTAVQVNDAPGFIVNRLMACQVREAMLLVEQGVASPEDIDTAVKLGLAHPIGPLALADLIGLDVMLAIFNALSSGLGERFAAPECLKDKLANGMLGRKTLAGFFNY
jgi:3-hydroxybutyryl-CoA dehydrogenase